MKFEIEVSNEILFSLLTGANFAYWGRYQSNVSATSIRKMLAGTHYILIEEIDEDTDAIVGIHRLNKQALQKGIKFMAAKYPNKLREVLDPDEADMYTGEFLLQCALFGEEKYA